MSFVPTLPIYVRERFPLGEEELALWTGLIFGGAPAAAAVLGPVWGVLGDRHGRKAMVLRAFLGIGAVTLLMPLADSPALLLALRILQGSLAGYIAPAMALVTADTPPHRQGEVIGRLQVALGVGMLAGPAIGAEVGVRFGRDGSFWLCGGLAFAAALLVALWTREDRTQLGGAGLSRFGSALWGFLSGSQVLGVLAVVFLVRFGQMMSEAFLALRVDEVGAVPPLLEWSSDAAAAIDRTTALMFVLVAIAQILLSPWWGRFGDRFGPLRALGVSSLLLAVGLLGCGLAQEAWVLTAFRCVAAVAMAAGMTLSYAAVQKRIQAGQRSLAFACVQSFMQLGMATGPLVGGVVAGAWTATGYGSVFVAAAVSLAAAAVAASLVRRRELAQRTGSPGDPGR